MSLSNQMRRAIVGLARSLWARIWVQVEARVASIEGRLVLIEGALNVMQRDPAAFFGSKSIAALSIRSGGLAEIQGLDHKFRSPSGGRGRSDQAPY